jgi:DNA replication and repair protein RecF
MQLVHLAAVGFRNLAPVDLRIEHPFTIIHGPNGQGKTNLLETIYLLCTLKPLRGSRMSEVIHWDKDSMSIGAGVQIDGVERRYRVDLSSSGRVATVDGQRVKALSQYFSDVRCVSFTPADGNIVFNEPAGRRKWVDRAAFTRNPVHLDLIRAYHRCRDQKSALLRKGLHTTDTLDVLDQQLSAMGAKVIHRRVQVLAELQPHVHALHAQISGTQEEILLRYKQPIVGNSEQELQQALLERFHQLRSEEIRRRSVLAGPQRDDVEILLAGKPARQFGSRGQVRSIVLALKLAELLAATERGQRPLFLLDDLSSELDEMRTKQLVRTLEKLGTQVFITTTDPSFLSTLPSSKTALIHVQNGILSQREKEV